MLKVWAPHLELHTGSKSGRRKDQIWILYYSYIFFEGYKGGNLWGSVLVYFDLLEISVETKDGTILGKTYGIVVVFNEVIKLDWHYGEVWCTTLKAAYGLSAARSEFKTEIVSSIIIVDGNEDGKL